MINLGLTLAIVRMSDSSDKMRLSRLLFLPLPLHPQPLSRPGSVKVHETLTLSFLSVSLWMLL
jgi:hypothetical protein